MTDTDPKAHLFLAGLAEQAQYAHDFAKAGQPTEAIEHAAAVERLITAWRLAAGHADHEAIHRHFGLSYANYLVLPRTLLQSMPDAWQAQLVRLLAELETAFDHVPQADSYEVNAGTYCQVTELGYDLLEELGITEDWYDEPVPEDLSPFDLAEWRSEHEKPGGPTYWRDGVEIDQHEQVFVPEEDPVPHYNRGRTRIQPRLDRTEVTA